MGHLKVLVWFCQVCGGRQTAGKRKERSRLEFPKFRNYVTLLYDVIVDSWFLCISFTSDSKKNPQFWCVNKCKGNLCYIEVQLLCCKMKVWKKFILGGVLALTSVPLVQCYRNWASKLTWSWSFSWFVTYSGKMEMSLFF